MRDIVYFSSIPWDYYHHRQQEMMTWFSKHGYRVFFWEPNGLTEKEYECKQLVKNLYLVRNRGLRFERCLSAINHLNSSLQEIAFYKLIQDHEVVNPIIWFDRIHGVAIDKMLKYSVCIYDLIDEITAFGRWKNSRMLLGIEKQVLSECGLVITSSKTLLERKITDPSVRTKFIPNGYDSRLLEGEMLFRGGSSTPVVGFCGAISKRRLDIELIETVASSLSDYSFHFIGPRDATANGFSFSSGNISIGNPVNPNELSELLSSFDVGIIPYRLNYGDMDYVFPKKAFEYMAVGLPVVSTSLPECTRFEEGIVCARTADEMSFEIANAVAASVEIRLKQRELARSYTWDALLPSLMGIIDDMN